MKPHVSGLAIRVIAGPSLAVLISLVVSLRSPSALAEEICEFSSWQAFAEYLPTKAPEWKVAALEKKVFEAAKETASLLPSSQLNGQYLSQGPLLKSRDIEAAYLFTFENKAKALSRQALVEADLGVFEAEMKDRQAQRTLQVALTRVTIRKLEFRREVLDETAETYAKIIETYERIPSRGPEQETALALMKMARGETLLRIKALDIEEKEVMAPLAALSACPNLILPIKGLAKIKAPEVIREKLAEQSQLFLKVEAQKNRLRAESDAEKKANFSDLTIGPMVSFSQDESKSRIGFGVQSSFTLGQKRADALSRMRDLEGMAKLNQLDLEQKRYQIERNYWLKKHSEAEEALKNSLDYSDIAKIHNRFEKLFRSDRISASLIIESHRQMLEHVTSYSDIEAKAAEAAWTLLYLDGRIEGTDI